MNFHRIINSFCADLLKDRRREAAESNRRRKLATRTPKSKRNLAKWQKKSKENPFA